MELRHLRYFIAVAEELNFSRAAERLHISQPPLSQQIQALEEELEVKLLDRKHRPLKLTLAGQTFLEEARLTLIQLEQATQITKRVHQGDLGYLTVGFTSSIPNSILPDILRMFQARFPSISLIWRELASQPQMQGLRDRQIDVGFFHVPTLNASDGDLDFMTVLQEPLILVLPESHRLASQTQISLKALASEAFVMPMRQIVPGLSEQIYHFCEQNGFFPNVIQEATLMLTILGLVSGGVGIALLPANAQNIQRKGVVYRAIQGKVPTVSMAAVWRRDDSSVILRHFLSVIQDISSLSLLAENQQ
ncbi:MAG: LysR family transcriptional regulator [Cyanobacteria bacterium CAN_BIN43]|nr:LysR family transcriptional regulator [Cyanobacteria bacterium CAN_BIN43]